MELKAGVPKEQADSAVPSTVEEETQLQIATTDAHNLQRERMSFELLQKVGRAKDTGPPNGTPGG